MTSAISMRAYTGANAATESGALATVSLSSTNDLVSTDVLPGTVSYERWLRLRVDSAPMVGAANFWLQLAGDLPDGVSLLFDVTDTAKTPVNTPSIIAKKELTAGQRFVFDAHTLAEVGDHTRYVVIQEVVDEDAASGAIPAQALTWGWVER
jgi:hypothetical protein